MRNHWRWFNGYKFSQKWYFTVIQIPRYINDLQTDIFCPHSCLRDSSPFSRIWHKLFKQPAKEKLLQKPVAELKSDLSCVFVQDWHCSTLL